MYFEEDSEILDQPEGCLTEYYFMDRIISRCDVETQFNMIPQIVQGFIEEKNKYTDNSTDQWDLSLDFVCNILKAYVFQETQQGKTLDRVLEEISLEKQMVLCQSRIHALGARASDDDAGDNNYVTFWKNSFKPKICQALCMCE